MRAEAPAVDISHEPSLRRLVDEARSARKPLLLQEDGQDVAEVRALDDAPKRRRRPLVGKPMTYDDPLWELIGSAHSEGPTDVSSNKHKYLAEAYTPKSE
jgi:hypothetical protein